MITCTKCGAQNSDDTRFCTRCNNKLQSSFRGQTVEQTPHDQPLGAFRHKGVNDDTWRDLKRMIEAWAYLILLAGVGFGCFWYQVWWPMYPAVGLLALLIWLRRV